MDPLPEYDMSRGSLGYGKVAVVTGANQGLGYMMVRGLYCTGFTVVMSCRDAEKCKAAKARLQKEEEDCPGKLETATLALDSFASVHEFAEKQLAHHGELAVLILNAGIWNDASPTKDGLSHTAQINHYGGFLLANLLLPKLLKTSDARIVVLGSAMHKEAQDFRLDPTLQDPKFRDTPLGAGLYGTSKLMNLLHARELHRRLRARSINSVSVFCVHPGIIKTNLHRSENDDSVLGKYVRPLMYWLIGASEWQGVQSTLWLATSPDAPELSGQYIHGLKARNSSSVFDTPENAAELWKISEGFTKSTIPS